MVISYNLSIDYVLYEMSYANVIMYGSVLPCYRHESDKDSKDNEVIDADDPGNRELARNVMFG
jgi:hypothetical protein